MCTTTIMDQDPDDQCNAKCCFATALNVLLVVLFAAQATNSGRLIVFPSSERSCCRSSAATSACVRRTVMMQWRPGQQSWWCVRCFCCSSLGSCSGRCAVQRPPDRAKWSLTDRASATVTGPTTCPHRQRPARGDCGRADRERGRRSIGSLGASGALMHAMVSLFFLLAISAQRSDDETNSTETLKLANILCCSKVVCHRPTTIPERRTDTVPGCVAHCHN